MPLLGLVHDSTNYANAFWDGQGHMFFGDGDGQLFTRLSASLDVIGHELTHGVTQFEANLVYQGQSGGAERVHVRRVRVAHQAVRQKADRRCGRPAHRQRHRGPGAAAGAAVHEGPGTANQYDKQPASMDDFVNTAADNGGVHINSGFPNHAFYTTTTQLGGNAWERAGRIWYDSLRDEKMKPTSGFKAFARATVRQAEMRFGAGSPEVDAVQAGWETVTVKV